MPEYIMFDVMWPRGQWVGFGFGMDMNMTDMFYLVEELDAQELPTVGVYDMWSTTKEGPPMMDDQLGGTQDWMLNMTSF